MDFAPDPGLEDLRGELRSFLAEHLTPELDEHLYTTGVSHDADFARALAERNWLAPDWPAEGGGAAFEPAEVHVITEELTRAEAPIYATSTTMMVARVIRAVGAGELEAEVLPGVLRGEVTIALGMSEPEAGSDVASVQTKARWQGDRWIVDGQKMFTTNGHVTDYVFLLARTDPASQRHRGLTTFLVPLDLPGIEVQAVFTLSGERTNITFYNGVELDDRWRIGEVGSGWQSLMVALQDEHSAPFSPHLDRLLEAVEAWAHEPDRAGAAPIARGDVQERLARAVASMEVAHLLDARTSWMEAEGQVPVAEGPMAKLFSTEAIVRCAEDLAALVGADGLRLRSDPTAVQGGRIEHALRFSLGTTIYAGTSEIQRNIIAQRRCDLPRA